MSADPAVEAAQRVWDRQIFDDPIDGFIASAREALKPIRELHRRGMSGMCWSGCGDEDGYNQAWPCDTAKLVYPESELE